MKSACAIPKLVALMVAWITLAGCTTPGVRSPVADSENHKQAVESEGGHRKGSGLWAKQLYQPAEHPRLLLAFHGEAKDVLVYYDERRGNSSKIRRRAYWLFAYSAKANNRSKPKFTSAAVCHQLNPIPLVEAGENDAAPAKGYVAFANGDSRSFLLWRDGQDLGVFELPVYEAAPPATVWRVGVTVVAAVAVVAVVGAWYAGGAPN
jgi:hypothetical protein